MRQDEIVYVEAAGIQSIHYSNEYTAQSAILGMVLPSSFPRLLQSNLRTLHSVHVLTTGFSCCVQPDARADEQAVEGSASQEEVEEHTFPVLKKGRLSFGGSDVIQGLLARRESAPGPASICGERELSQIARPRALIVTPKVPEEVAPGKGSQSTFLITLILEWIQFNASIRDAPPMEPRFFVSLTMWSA